jgi:hypothetical protein
MKLCHKCGIEKEINLFYKNRTTKDGYRADCKSCYNIYIKKWNELNPGKHTQYDATWQNRNPGRVKEKGDRWKANNRERHLENKRKQEERRRTTVEGRLHDSIHRRVYDQLKKGKCRQKTFELIGYSPEDLRRHIEKKFKAGMTWENYGQWHIDHIIPMSAFNITSPDDIDFRRCWALKNLQPLWAKENLTKWAKLDKHFQPALAIAA